MDGWHVSPVRPTHLAATSSFTCRFIQLFCQCWPLLGCMLQGMLEMVLRTLKRKLLTRRIVGEEGGIRWEPRYVRNVRPSLKEPGGSTHGAGPMCLNGTNRALLGTDPGPTADAVARLLSLGERRTSRRPPGAGVLQHPSSHASLTRNLHP